jgi:hypothetical protein
MIRTGASGSFEHVGAYLITTLLLVFAYPRSPPWIVGGALSMPESSKLVSSISPGDTVSLRTLPRAALALR